MSLDRLYKCDEYRRIYANRKDAKSATTFQIYRHRTSPFYELVAICNGEDWRDVFDCSNIELCFALNVNEKTLIKARESLINAGLIYYKSGKTNVL